MDHFAAGQSACQGYYESQAFGGYTQNIRAEDAIKLFLPAPNEQLMMVATPMPKARAAWIRGFKAARAEMLAASENSDSSSENAEG